MAYDVEFTAGINDAAVQRSLEKVRTAEVRHMASMRREASRGFAGTLGSEARGAAGRLLGGGRLGGVVSGGGTLAATGFGVATLGIGAVMANIVKSTEQYAKHNERAQESMLKQERALARTDRAWSGFWYQLAGRHFSDFMSWQRNARASVGEHVSRAVFGTEKYNKMMEEQDRARSYQTGLVSASLGAQSAANILRRSGRGDQAGIVEEMANLVTRNEDIRRQRQGNMITDREARVNYRLAEQDYQTGIVSNFQSSFYSGIGGGATKDIIDSIAGPGGDVLPRQGESVGGEVGEMVNLLRQLVEIQRDRQAATVGR